MLNIVAWPISGSCPPLSPQKSTALSSWQKHPQAALVSFPAALHADCGSWKWKERRSKTTLNKSINVLLCINDSTVDML